MGIVATPTYNTVPFRAADFSTLVEALDYAALGETGFNFYSARGELDVVLPYVELRRQARLLARRLLSLGVERGARLVVLAETNPDFMRFFFACQYAGLVPVPVPIPMNLGSHNSFVGSLRGMLQTSAASVAVAPTEYAAYLHEAAGSLALRLAGEPGDFDALPASDEALHPVTADELAYLQYTSGSTRFPRGVMIDQSTVLSNLAGIVRQGVKVKAGDRCVSWLPFYHDMGLVGLVLGPLASQTSVDYLRTRDFAMRPRQWLRLLSRSKATISFSPPFGYELCARRLRPDEVSELDLSAWRVAGVGAETINAQVLENFANVLAPGKFDKRAFVPCYGMAECSLAVSFAPLGRGVDVDRVASERLAREGRAVALNDSTGDDSRSAAFVDCGAPLPEYQVEIRDSNGSVMSDRHTGTVFLKGPSVMSGYFGDPESTAESLSEDGWLDTGDIGYRVDGRLFITGRRKDLIIINGRNVWPQDLEYLAEQQPEVRTGDCLAFSAPGPGGEESAVMVVQCRETDAGKRADLIKRLQSLARSELGIDCYVELASLHTLPRTSSGKLSRSKAREQFVQSHRWGARECLPGAEADLARVG